MAGLFDQTGYPDQSAPGPGFGLFGTNTQGQQALFPELNNTPEFRMPEWKRKQLEADRALRNLGLSGDELDNAKLQLFAPDVLQQRRQADEEQRQKAEWDRRQKAQEEQALRMQKAADEMLRARQQEDDDRQMGRQMEAEQARQAAEEKQRQLFEQKKQQQIEAWSSLIEQQKAGTAQGPGMVETSPGVYGKPPTADEEVLKHLADLGVPVHGVMSNQQWGQMVADREKAAREAAINAREVEESKKRIEEAVKQKAKEKEEADRKGRYEEADKAYKEWVGADAVASGDVKADFGGDAEKKAKATMEAKKAEAIYKAHSGENEARAAVTETTKEGKKYIPDYLKDHFNMTEATPGARLAKANAIYNALQSGGWSDDAIRKYPALWDYLNFLRGK